MKYTIDYTSQAVKDLKKMDRSTRALILDWVEKNLVGCVDPYQHGKALVGDLRDKWRYRVGDYRLLAHILRKKVIVIVLREPHSKY